MEAWVIRVWDGNSTRQISRKGTYEQVRATINYPPGYIWDIVNHKDIK